jgi:hypothetical protein
MSDLPIGVYETEDGRYVNEDGRYVDPTTGNPLTYNPLMGGNSILDAVMGINETGGLGEQELPYTAGEDGNFYNEDGERLYYWAEPNELGDVEDRESRRDNAMAMAESGSYYGNYYTMDEIQEAWDADEGMGFFKAANPDLTWEQYQAFITERQGMIQDGTMGNGLTPYTEIADNYGDMRDDPNAGYGGDASLIGDSYMPMDELENEAYTDLLGRYGIQTKYMNDDGDIFVFNGSTYDKIFKTDDHAGFTDIMDMVAQGMIGAAFGMGLTQVLSGYMSAGLADTVSRFIVSQVQGGGGDIGITDALGLAFGGGIPELGGVEDALFDEIVGVVKDTVLDPDNYDPQGGDWDGEVVWRDPNVVDGEDPEFDPDSENAYDPELVDPSLPDYVPPPEEDDSTSGGGGAPDSGGDEGGSTDGDPADPADPADGNPDETTQGQYEVIEVLPDGGVVVRDNRDGDVWILPEGDYSVGDYVPESEMGDAVGGEGDLDSGDPDADGDEEEEVVDPTIPSIPGYTPPDLPTDPVDPVDPVDPTDPTETPDTPSNDVTDPTDPEVPGDDGDADSGSGDSTGGGDEGTGDSDGDGDAGDGSEEDDADGDNGEGESGENGDGDGNDGTGRGDGGDGFGDGDDLGAASGLMSGHNPDWGELYGYSPFKVYEPGKGLEPVSGLLKGYLT